MKHIHAIIILLICTAFIFININRQKKPQYRVIDVYSSDKICIDINRNNKCDINEKIKLYGISSFPQKFGKRTFYLKEKYNINEEDSVVLGILADEFTKKELLNKFVTIETLNEQFEDNYKLSKIYSDNTDFSQIILKNGWATTSNIEEYKIFENMTAIKKNIAYSKKFNYQLKNKANGKIHTLTCEYGRKTSDYEIGIFDDEKYKKDYCGVCHKIKDKATTKQQNSKKSFQYESNNIQVYFLDFSLPKPRTTCSTSACKALLTSINNSKSSIDFAIYGMGNIPEIQKALAKAQARGIKIRFIVDEDSKNNNIYIKTPELKQAITNYKTDYQKDETAKFNNYIMHNKFFIIDKEIIWTGSANVSETDLSEFNANNVVYIKSKELAKIYESEFENMYNGSFHTKKSAVNNNSQTIDGTTINVRFSPQDKIITNYLIPKIISAKKSIYISTFIFTHKPLAEEIIKAHNRGLDVKIIVDATSASNNYSMVRKMRENGIPVKIENRAGKMHMKTIIIDDSTFITGSMNLTKSAEAYNDENMLFMTNTALTATSKDFFNYLWDKIPNKYLKLYISAESKDSIGSCSDGIDNDYNGLIDTLDPKCK